MFKATHTLLLAASLTSVALGGCNAVLGIDEAHLTTDEGGAAGRGNRVTTPLIKNCEAPSTACSSCMASDCARLPQDDCLGDQACRLQLNAYRVCLGASCSDTSGCMNALVKAENDLRAASAPKSPYGLSSCVNMLCASQCQDNALVTPCQLYCACMAPNCAGKVDPTTCLAECAKQPPADILCRWTHCEMAAADPLGDHCDHAVGVSFCQTNTTYAPACSQGLSQDTFACSTNADCCSNICDHHVCRAAN